MPNPETPAVRRTRRRPALRVLRQTLKAAPWRVLSPPTRPAYDLN
jgi:hypothetical protein